MFRFSRKIDYALRMMIALAEVAGDRVTSKNLAIKTGVTKPFLHKIASDLVQAGLVFTYMGPKGGLELAKEIDEISLLEIVEAVERPLILDPHVLYANDADDFKLTRPFWNEMQVNIISLLQTISLSDILANSTAGENK